MKYPCLGCLFDEDCNDRNGKAKFTCLHLKKYLDSIVSQATAEGGNMQVKTGLQAGGGGTSPIPLEPPKKII